VLCVTDCQQARTQPARSTQGGWNQSVTCLTVVEAPAGKHSLYVRAGDMAAVQAAHRVLCEDYGLGSQPCSDSLQKVAPRVGTVGRVVEGVWL
jgi:hypothetical protein